MNSYLAKSVGVVAFTLYDLPAFPDGTLFAQPDLIFNGGFALLVGRVAGIDGNPGHDWSPESESVEYASSGLPFNSFLNCILARSRAIVASILQFEIREAY